MEAFKNEYEIIKENMYNNISLIKNKKNNNKYILKKIYMDTEELNKNENEAKILKKLEHENIVKYYDSFKDNSYFFIIMEYCQNSDLRNFIKNYKDNNNQSIEESIISSIVLDICAGIKEIHKNNIIHRDLKPENIFITDEHKCKVGDFGISKKLEGTNHAKTQGIGTIFYMAPELLSGNPYDNKVDIWGLGCIIYELFTLEQCFGDNNLITVINRIKEGVHGKINLEKYSSDWQDLIDSLLQKEPEKRPNIEDVYNKVNELKNKNSEMNDDKKKRHVILDNMFRNCNKLKVVHLNSKYNLNLLKNQLEKDNINPKLIIK